MGIVRNSIDVLGLTPEDALPRGICGQLIETSETEHIHITKATKVKSIDQINVNVKIIGTRIINAPLNRIVVLDCLKTFKIAYYDEADQKEVFEYKSPFNCFIDIENKNDEIEEVEINVVDAFFDLLDSNTIYNHILYIINIKYCSCMKCSVISKREKIFSVIPFKKSDCVTDSDWTMVTDKAIGIATTTAAETTTEVLGSASASASASASTSNEEVILLFSSAASTSTSTPVQAKAKVSTKALTQTHTSASTSVPASSATPNNAAKYYEITFHKETIKEIGIATQNEVSKVNELIDLEAEYL